LGRAFLYTDGLMYDLNAVVVSGLAGATLIEALGINDGGQIVANSCVGDGGNVSCRAYRLDLVPAEVPALSGRALAATAIVLFVASLLGRRVTG